jgi:hypothetical protein
MDEWELYKMEDYTTGTGQRLKVHDKKDCKGRKCVIHNPSNHCMKDFPTHWRDDISIMERICPHGVGHPDPDDLKFRQKEYKKKHKKDGGFLGIHGCDGCCSPKKRKKKNES